jgi:hypothetical protein
MKRILVLALCALPMMGQDDAERLMKDKDSPLQIVTPFVPNSSPTQPYSVVARATGGSAPYRWSLTSGCGAAVTLRQAGDYAVLTGANNFTGRCQFTIRVQSKSQMDAVNVWFVKGVQ